MHELNMFSCVVDLVGMTCRKYSRHESNSLRGEQNKLYKMNCPSQWQQYKGNKSEKCVRTI